MSADSAIINKVLEDPPDVVFRSAGVSTHKMLFELNRVHTMYDGWQAILVEGQDAIEFIKTGLDGIAPCVTLKVGTNRFSVFFNTRFDLYVKANNLLNAEPCDVWVGVGAFHANDCSPETTWIEADVALCGRFVSPGTRVHKMSAEPLRMRGVLERFLQAFDRPATILPFLDGFGTLARNGGFGIDDVLWVYNMFCITWNHVEESFSDERFTVVNRHELCSLFRNVDEMGLYLKGLAAELLRQKGPSGPVPGERFEDMLRYVEARCSEPIYLADLAENFHYNPTYVSDLFRRHLGLGFSEHLATLRMNRAKSMLRETELSITEIANRCGYSDSCHFARQFRKISGCTPSTFRNSLRNFG